MHIQNILYPIFFETNHHIECGISDAHITFMQYWKSDGGTLNNDACIEQHEME